MRLRTCSGPVFAPHREGACLHGGTAAGLHLVGRTALEIGAFAQIPMVGLGRSGGGILPVLIFFHLYRERGWVLPPCPRLGSNG